MDLAQRLPISVLLIVVGLCVVFPLLAGALVGGWLGLAVVLLGVLGLLSAGSLIALKVHISRLPLQLSVEGARARLDGHPSFHFRAQLGLGRRMESASASVHFLPDDGDAIELEPLLARGERLHGPWTLVVVDRDERIQGEGRFHVRVEVEERGKRWEVERDYPVFDLVEGRFIPPVGTTALSLSDDSPNRFDRIHPRPPVS